ncbi:MAG: hypothetical protein JSW28_05420, partial [Thermoplasmata archaeon]
TGKTQWQGAPIGNVNMTFVAVRYEGGVNNSAESGPAGNYVVDLMPGEYRIIVNHNTTENNKPVRYEYNFALHLDVGEGSRARDINLTKHVKINGSVAGTTENVTINFEPLEDGEDETITATTVNSSFELYLESSEYNLWIDHEADAATHYVYLNTFDFLESQTLQLNVSLGVEVIVEVRDDDSDKGGINVSFSEDGMRTVKSDSGGDFTVFLPPNRTYNVTVNQTEEDDDGLLWYTYSGAQVVNTSTVWDFNIDLTKYGQISGAVFIDYNENDAPDPEEVLDNLTVMFESALHNVTVTTDGSGVYGAFLLDDIKYNITVSGDFPIVDEELNRTFKIRDNPHDFAVTPLDLTISGQTLLNESPIGNTVLYFFAESEAAKNGSAISDTSGHFSIELPSGEYTLYAKKASGSDVFVYFGQISAKPRETKELEIMLEPGLKVSGHVYYINSTEQNHSAQVTVEFKDGGTVTTGSLANGQFEIWLPKGTYNLRAEHSTFEYNMSMEYGYSGEMRLENHMNLYVFLDKEREYGVELEWLEGEVAEIAQNKSTIYRMRIENTGNTKETFDLSRTGVATWNITFNSSITLDIHESREFEVHITASTIAKVDHGKIEISAVSRNDPNTKDSVEIEVNITQIFKAANITLGDEPITAINNSLVYTVNVENRGNGDENFTLSLYGVPADWDATLKETELALIGGEIRSVPLTINISYTTTTKSALLRIEAKSASNKTTVWELDVTLVNLELGDEDVEITGESVSEGPVDTSTIPGFEALALLAALIGAAIVLRRRRSP